MLFDFDDFSDSLVPNSYQYKSQILMCTAGWSAH
jgi:hypothetical protein